jgi:hypothetical protein
MVPGLGSRVLTVSDRWPPPSEASRGSDVHSSTSLPFRPYCALIRLGRAGLARVAIGSAPLLPERSDEGRPATLLHRPVR